ncbi:DUF1648 domain-containing protein [Epilithonimonas arachidiradicis]|uniref:Uncharacterized protein DUF1648 n=1 Tax=Epilithonimonas arachidiradicis TaxID=1617282 RepID=A0A420D8I7_9FLAO|nr:DUF1648 domain-containing protein [Epilithonimonas arachidiradicis]RKE86845.1 uncharacterized protein DUF1648 [Epilithonimonas arachidiradicis]GGG61581.1 hypothetical protein GCM10007332_24400 [Epilithonimonas arachidiradicis]
MKVISFVLKIISFLILIFIWIFTIVNFKKLPEIVPIHYNLDGIPDGFGSRGTIWFETGLTTVLFLFLMYVSKKPDFPLLNIPQNIKDNPILTEFVVSVLLLIIMLIFADINYESIQNALGKTNGLGSMMHYLLGLVFIFVVGLLIYSYKISKRQKLQG